MSRSPPSGESTPTTTADAAASELLDVEDLLRDLDTLVDEVDSPGPQEGLQEAQALLALAGRRGLIGSRIRRLRPRDAAEALVGSVVFASPLLVEDGIFDIAAHLFQSTVAGVPVFLIANTAFLIVMTYALLEWTGRNKTETHYVLGVVPTRLVMILGVSFVVSAILMTVWGRVGDWQPTSEAIARITVLWTVGALGAALGDVLSNPHPAPIDVDVDPGAQTTPPGSGESRPFEADGLTDAELLATLYSQIDQLAEEVESDATRGELQALHEQIHEAAMTDRFGQEIQKYTSRDIAEAFVGSIFFSIPFLVEDGVFDVAEYFLSFRIGQFPVFFLLNAAFVFALLALLIYGAGPQTVRVSRPLFGIIPRRLVGIALISFLTAGALATMWGRVDNWADPTVAIARISVIWTVAAFGAALGDMLPGESSGADIYDEIAEITGMAEEMEEAEMPPRDHR